MLIPIYDNNPTRTFPYVTLTLIALNILAFMYELSLGLGSPLLNEFVFRYGAVPSQIYPALLTADLFSQPILTIFTSIFLHAGWLHIAGNMLYLWIFGNNIEDHFGHFRFLIFYLLAGVAGSLGHVLFNAVSPIPSVGASGAIAGVLGAYLVLYPRAQVVTAVFIVIIIRLISLPAVIVLGMWLALNLLSGFASIGTESAQQGGVAWFAHLGGFALGVIAAFLFPRKRYD